MRITVIQPPSTHQCEPVYSHLNVFGNWRRPRRPWCLKVYHCLVWLNGGQVQVSIFASQCLECLLLGHNHPIDACDFGEMSLSSEPWNFHGEPDGHVDRFNIKSHAHLLQSLIISSRLSTTSDVTLDPASCRCLLSNSFLICIYVGQGW